MSKSSVVSFMDKQAEIHAKAEFLDLLDRDISGQVAVVQPFPPALLGRIQALRAKVERNRVDELQEG